MSNGYKGLIIALVVIGGVVAIGVVIAFGVVNFLMSGASQVISAYFNAWLQSITDAINQAIQDYLQSIPGFEPFLLIGIFSILVVAVLSFYHFKFKER